MKSENIEKTMKSEEKRKKGRQGGKGQEKEEVFRKGKKKPNKKVKMSYRKGMEGKGEKGVVEERGRNGK